MVSDIPAGDGKIMDLFYCVVNIVLVLSYLNPGAGKTYPVSEVVCEYEVSGEGLSKRLVEVQHFQQSVSKTEVYS